MDTKEVCNPVEPEQKKVKVEDQISNFSHSLTEETVGLTEYVVKDNPGFKGIIKHRFSDFLVNEIDKNNKVLILEHDDEDPNFLPLPERKKGGEIKLDLKIEEVEQENQLDFDDLFEQLGNLYKESKVIEEGKEIEEILKESYEKIKELIETKGQSNSSGYTIPLNIEAKDTRTAVHMLIREKVGDKIMTRTGDNNTIQYIFMKSKGQKNKNKIRTNKNSLVNKERYLHFNLYKENKDTMEVLNLMAKFLKTNTKNFAFSGTKDKRGITVQKISALNVDKDRMKSLLKGIKDAEVSSFSKSTEPLRLGELNGNQFNIVIRELKIEEYNNEQVQNKINEVLKTFSNSPGFINYFGMQRFGTNKIGTHEVGIAMLQSNFKKAVELLLLPREGDNDRIKIAREHWKTTQDPKSSLEKFPNYLVAERAILHAFVESKDKNNCFNALKKIPRNLRLIYLHAYQSYVFNHAVSKRLSTFGFNPIIGDLIILENGNVKMIESEDELDQYSIQDVIFPLPGHQVIYPKYKEPLNQLYENIMQEHNLSPNKMIRSDKDLSLTGDYRKIVIQPKNIEWEFIKYTDPDAQLILSDLDRLNRKEDIKSLEDGDKLALILKFSLPPSTYATMLLRELLHCQTDKAALAS